MNPETAFRLGFTKRLATDAGKIILKYYGKRQDGRMKSAREVVTDADIASEEFIISNIEKEFGEPSLSEETRSETTLKGPLWIIDPLDGTNNFARGFPFFCVIIAFFDKGKTRLEVIYEPLRKELFWTDGKSSFLNGEKIKVSDTGKLCDCLAATGFPYNRGGGNETNLDNFVRAQMAIRGVRRGGSAGLDLAYTAAGRLDFYWELNLKPWDIAAGELMVRCAGGKTGLLDGSPYKMGSDRILAGAPKVFDKVAVLLTHGTTNS